MEIKQLIELLTVLDIRKKDEFTHETLKDGLIGKHVIIRTYSAGVHFGILKEKQGNEVILTQSRRLWFWKTKNNGISLSEIANHGVHKESKICETLDMIWLEAIEIIPCSKNAIKSLEGADVFKA